jgi:hypothetical protein
MFHCKQPLEGHLLYFQMFFNVIIPTYKIDGRTKEIKEKQMDE